MKEPASLDSLPAKVKRTIVRQADEPTKFSLRRISKSFRSIVDSTPDDVYEFVQFIAKAGQIIVRWTTSRSQHEVSYVWKRVGCVVRTRGKNKLLENSNFAQTALHDFQSIFMKPSVTVKVLNFCVRDMAMPVEGRIDEFYETQLEIVGSMAEFFRHLGRKIPVEEVKLEFMSSVATQDSIMAFLPHFETTTLKTIELRALSGHQKVPVDSYGFRELVCYKQAEKLFTGSFVVDIPLQNLLHFNQLTITIAKLTPEDVLLLKETYRNSTTFLNSTITCNQMSKAAVDAALEPMNEDLNPYYRLYRKPDRRTLLLKVLPGAVHFSIFLGAYD